MVFKRLFERRWRTRLEAGGSEPLYRPAAGECDLHRVVFTRDYFASALHEVAHWTIAGPERRQRLDYGYWYAPDGRDQRQQQAFEQVEVKPQALEWIFSRAADFPFRPSADNLDGSGGLSDSFRSSVWRQAQVYCERGLPTRAAQFVEELVAVFGVTDALDAGSYRLEDI